MRPLILASVIASALLAACFIPPDPPGAQPDGGPGTPDAPGVACAPAAAPPGNGHHNAGLNCLGCHTGSGVPRWTAAGTLYNAARTQPVVGATITLVDATGKKVSIVTATNGNFWTSEALTAPLRVTASRCPTSASMTMGAMGACNSCHTNGGNPGRIALP